MESNYRKLLLKQWGRVIERKDWSEFYPAIESSNPWFTIPAIELALSGVCRYLSGSNIDKWTNTYNLPKTSNRSIVGLIMAGNLPLVGIHDLICLIMAGCKAMIKMSSQDQVLLPLLFEELLRLEPDFEKLITFTSDISPSELDAIITTGSDNTAKYIQHYYAGVPQIIRSNRTSLAIIRGDESGIQLANLGTDIFSYYGRGCRNVSKIMVPPGYDFDEFVSNNQTLNHLKNHKNYSNNYHYQKALFNTKNSEYFDTGFCLLSRNQQLVSPLAVVYYDYYENPDQLSNIISLSSNKIQAIASADGWFNSSYNFGQLQLPDLWDYSDNIDTMNFLLELS